MAAQAAAHLATQRTETPAQQIVNHYHQPAQPQPIFVQPDMSNISEAMRHYGLTMQQLFMSRQQEPAYRPPRDEIPITYSDPPAPPPPPGGAGAIQKSFGPAKLPRSRSAPFSGGGPPPTPGGATAPMPVEQRFPRGDAPIRREYFPQRPVPPPPAQPPAPPPAPPVKGQKRKGQMADALAKRRHGDVALLVHPHVPAGKRHRRQEA